MRLANLITAKLVALQDIQDVPLLVSVSGWGSGTTTGGYPSRDYCCDASLHSPGAA